MINHWFVTRPKRRLVLLVDALKVSWRLHKVKCERNRALHLLYEDALETAGVKARRTSRPKSWWRANICKLGCMLRSLV